MPRREDGPFADKQMNLGKALRLKRRKALVEYFAKRSGYKAAAEALGILAQRYSDELKVARRELSVLAKTLARHQKTVAAEVAQ